MDPMQNWIKDGHWPKINSRKIRAIGQGQIQ